MFTISHKSKMVATADSGFAVPALPFISPVDHTFTNFLAEQMQFVNPQPKDPNEILL